MMYTRYEIKQKSEEIVIKSITETFPGLKTIEALPSALQDDLHDEIYVLSDILARVQNFLIEND